MNTALCCGPRRAPGVRWLTTAKYPGYAQRSHRYPTIVRNIPCSGSPSTHAITLAQPSPALSSLVPPVGPSQWSSCHHHCNFLPGCDFSMPRRHSGRCSPARAVLCPGEHGTSSGSPGGATAGRPERSLTARGRVWHPRQGGDLERLAARFNHSLSTIVSSASDRGRSPTNGAILLLTVSGNCSVQRRFL